MTVKIRYLSRQNEDDPVLSIMTASTLRRVILISLLLTRSWRNQSLAKAREKKDSGEARSRFRWDSVRQRRLPFRDGQVTACRFLCLSEIWSEPPSSSRSTSMWLLQRSRSRISWISRRSMTSWICWLTKFKNYRTISSYTERHCLVFLIWSRPSPMT